MCLLEEDYFGTKVNTVAGIPGACVASESDERGSRSCAGLGSRLCDRWLVGNQERICLSISVHADAVATSTRVPPRHERCQGRRGALLHLRRRRAHFRRGWARDIQWMRARHFLFINLLMSR